VVVQSEEKWNCGFVDIYGWWLILLLWESNWEMARRVRIGE